VLPDHWEDVEEDMGDGEGEGEGEKDEDQEDEEEDDDDDEDQDEDEEEKGEGDSKAPVINMAEESAVYGRIRAKKSSEEIKRWRSQLRAAALETGLLLHHKAATESQCVKEAKAAQKELQSYVSILSLR
jgi:hypothetical protein